MTRSTSLIRHVVAVPALALFFAVALRAGDFAGRWEGRPTLPDGTPLTVTFDFAVNDGKWTGSVETVEYGKFAANDIVVTGDRITFDVETDGGTYHNVGTLTPEGLSMEGTGPDGPISPVLYKRPAANLVGKWRGKLQTPDGPADVFYTFEKRDGKLTGTVSSSLGEAALKDIAVDGSHVEFASDYGGFSVKRRGTVTGDTMQLTITIDGNDLPATFTREPPATAAN